MHSENPHTCLTCRVVFKDADFQRQHYKSDWHRYNLKRKVAELPSVSAEEFNQKVKEQRAKDEDASQNHTKYCECCSKNFRNDNSYVNHLKSKRHQEKEDAKQQLFELRNALMPPLVASENETNKANDEVEIATSQHEDSDGWESGSEIDDEEDTECLFCDHHSRSLVRNMRHMSQAHSFFVPDLEYCVDLSGLVRYLGEKVRDGFLCLWCNETGKAFASHAAAQGHMRDKGHCKMLHEGADTLAEYVDFYDYSSSYPDEGDKDEHAEKVDIDILESSDADYQLVLPSGSTIGHRSLMRYYKQNLAPANAQAVCVRRQTKLHKVLLTQYRSLGWVSTQKEIAVRKAKDIRHMQRAQSRWNLALSIKANKCAQPHFRQQVNY